jgi:8-oxo-dGTP pyrophosphatase MutT (NUDIX family)
MQENKINRHKITCTNCGQMGHDQKHCKEPIISFGIIVVKINKDTSDYLGNKVNNIDLIKKRLKINTNSLDNKLTKYINNIQILMICRKHSLGFSEFVRGKYNVENIRGIYFLFQQMTPKEINDIKIKTFDELWNSFWVDDSKKEMFEKDYLASKDKFTKLKEKKNVELSLDFYVNTVKPLNDIPERGFPKGRRQKNESDIDCALREFKEETNFSIDNINLVENVNPIEEDITGTNGVKYRHVYYLAEAKTDLIPVINKDNISQISEIGDIGFFIYDEALRNIREYHLEKKNIVTNIISYYVHLMISNN